MPPAGVPGGSGTGAGRTSGSSSTIEVGIRMPVTIGAAEAPRQVWFHDPAAPPATVIRPSAFVAGRGLGGRLLLVRRCDSGAWEFPGGCVDGGGTVAQAAVRGTFEEAGGHALVPGPVGPFTHP